MRLLLILLLGGLMDAARSFAPLPGIGSGAAGTALACGYLLLTAFLAGSLFESVGLPRLTGYIVVGIVAGPAVLNLVSAPMVDNLQVFNGVAIALIALTAGVELDLRALRPLLRSVSFLTVIAVIGTAALLSAVVYSARDLLPFMSRMTTGQVVAVSLVLGITMAAQSPAVVVALHSEVQASGPLSRAVLGVVVVSDLVVIVLFAVVSSVTKTFFGSRADALQAAGSLAWQIFGSIAAGLVAGVLISLYLRYVKGGAALFVIAVTLVIAEVGRLLHFDPLIVALAAGILVRNVMRQGDRLHAEIEASSLPVYVVFFAITGAGIDLQQLRLVGLPVVLFVVVRAAAFVVGGWIAASLAGAPAVVRRYAGLGLIPQAGVTLALALLLVKTFPRFGADASALLLGVVAVSQIVGPVLYRWALMRSGEAGRLARIEESPPGFAAHPAD